MNTQLWLEVYALCLILVPGKNWQLPMSASGKLLKQKKPKQMTQLSQGRAVHQHYAHFPQADQQHGTSQETCTATAAPSQQLYWLTPGYDLQSIRVGITRQWACVKLINVILLGLIPKTDNLPSLKIASFSCIFTYFLQFIYLIFWERLCFFIEII